MEPGSGEDRPLCRGGRAEGCSGDPAGEARPEPCVWNHPGAGSGRHRRAARDTVRGGLARYQGLSEVAGREADDLRAFPERKIRVLRTLHVPRSRGLDNAFQIIRYSAGHCRSESVSRNSGRLRSDPLLRFEDGNRRYRAESLRRGKHGIPGPRLR